MVEWLRIDYYYYKVYFLFNFNSYHNERVLKIMKKIQSSKALFKCICIALSSLFILSSVACSSGEDEDFNISVDSSNSSDTSDTVVTSLPISAGRNIDISLIKCLSDQVNIRSGPGTEHQIVGTANANAYFKYTITEGSWHKIIFNGQDAYISSNFSQIESMNLALAEPIMKGITVSTTPPVDTGSDTSSSTDTSSTPEVSTPEISTPQINVTPSPVPGTGEDGQVNRLDP